METILDLLLSTLRYSTPIMFAALGILIMQSAGVINIGAEGMLLVGTFFGYTGTALLGNPWLGALVAMVATGLYGLLFGLFVIHLRANQVVVGVAFNILAVGLTTTLYRLGFGVNTSVISINGFEPLFEGLSVPVFVGIVLAFVLTWFFRKTKQGLMIRSVGENPLAVDSVGLNVYKIRYLSTLLGAMVIGFGGAYLSTGLLSTFSEEMTASRGYIALAAVAFGRYQPLGVLLAVWVFGLGSAVQFRLAALDSPIPIQFLQMIPYLLTIVAVVFFVKKSGEPAALGKSYKKL